MAPVDRLIAAAQAGQVAEVRSLATADPGLLTARSMFGAGAVHAACWRGLGRVAGELLSAGADPALTATDGPHQGETPAATARAQGHDDLAARLDAAD